MQISKRLSTFRKSVMEVIDKQDCTHVLKVAKITFMMTTRISILSIPGQTAQT